MVFHLQYVRSVKNIYSHQRGHLGISSTVCKIRVIYSHQRGHLGISSTDVRTRTFTVIREVILVFHLQYVRSVKNIYSHQRGHLGISSTVCKIMKNIYSHQRGHLGISSTVCKIREEHLQSSERSSWYFIYNM